MKAWRTLLAGLTIWLAHFALVYALPSLEAIGAMPRPRLLAINGVATLVCLVAVGILASAGWRKARAAEPPGEAFRQRVAALGAALAGVAIAWQAVPAWLN